MNSKPSPWQIFVAQLNNYMSKVLLGLSGLSLLAGKPGNALLGSGVLLANTALAVLQEIALKINGNIHRLYPPRRAGNQGRETSCPANSGTGPGGFAAAYGG